MATPVITGIRSPSMEMGETTWCVFKSPKWQVPSFPCVGEVTRAIYWVPDRLGFACQPAGQLRGIGGDQSQSKSIAESGAQTRDRVGARDWAPEQLFQRRNAAAGDAARGDQIEKAQIGGNVAGESVGSHPAADVHADGAQFFFTNGTGIAAGASSNPHARASRNAESANAEAGSSLNHGLLELAHVPHDVTPNSVQVENGIADDLDV